MGQFFVQIWIGCQESEKVGGGGPRLCCAAFIKAGTSLLLLELDDRRMITLHQINIGAGALQR